MRSDKLSTFYDNRKKNYHSRTDALRLLLMPFAFFVLLGFPGEFGGYISVYSNFVPEVFFILFGFFTLVPDTEKRYKKLKKGFKRALRLFILMFISFVALSVIYCYYINPEASLFGTQTSIKRAIFNFFVLNVWPLPVGNSIWFVQSLVYAYLFFMLAEKTGLRKLYLPIFILLMLFTLSTGEFAAFLGFPHFGYSYIPGGALTRAIPYMLCGMLLRKHVDLLSKIPRHIYLLFFPIGLAAAIGEIELLRYFGKLVYTGHTIGFGIMALSLCCYSLSRTRVLKGFLSNHGRNYSRRMYALCQPVALLCWFITKMTNPQDLYIIYEYSSLISLVICYAITFLIGFVVFRIKDQKNNQKHKRGVPAERSVDEIAEESAEENIEESVEVQ